MSTLNSKVSGIIACSRVSSGSCHGNHASASTDGMVACVSVKRSSFHGYLADNASSSHGDPVNIASTTGKLKSVYVGETNTLSPSFTYIEYKILPGKRK